MRKLILLVILVVYAVSMAAPCLPYGSIGFPAYIRSPDQLADWLKSEFTYEMKFPDYKQTVEETLKRHSGDCDDFASLSSSVLDNLGIKNDIVVIKFRQLGIMHAVCAFKDGKTYSFISNRSIVRTNGHSTNEAIAEIYPDWERLIYTSTGGKELRVVDRGYTGGAGSATLSIPSMCSDLIGPEQRDMGMIEFMLAGQLSNLKRSGMRFGISTLIMIFKDGANSHFRFLFRNLQLTPEGFRVPCVAEDIDGTRTYYATFSISEDLSGFKMSVYPESDLKRVNQFNDVMPHPLESEPA